MVAINCDMGEAFGIYHCGDDEGIMPYITIANVACGFHAVRPDGDAQHGRAGQAARRQGRRPPVAAPTARASGGGR